MTVVRVVADRDETDAAPIPLVGAIARTRGYCPVLRIHRSCGRDQPNSDRCRCDWSERTLSAGCHKEGSDKRRTACRGRSKSANAQENRRIFPIFLHRDGERLVSDRSHDLDGAGEHHTDETVVVMIDGGRRMRRVLRRAMFM